jgi:hypothetical protein
MDLQVIEGKEKQVHSTTLRFAQDDRSPIGLFENSASS